MRLKKYLNDETTTDTVKPGIDAEAVTGKKQKRIQKRKKKKDKSCDLKNT